MDFNRDTLIARLKRGDEAALMEIRAILGPQIIRNSAGVLHDREEADDILNSTMLKVWERRASLSDVFKEAASFVLTIAHREAIDEYRTRSRRAKAAAMQRLNEDVDTHTEPSPVGSILGSLHVDRVVTSFGKRYPLFAEYLQRTKLNGNEKVDSVCQELAIQAGLASGTLHNKFLRLEKLLVRELSVCEG